jgi:hypothetical protein
MSSGQEVCSGSNLALLLGLYWVAYMVINAVVFAGAMYGLQQCLEKVKFPGSRGSGGGGKIKGDKDSNVSHTGSRVSLVSGGKY